MTPRPSAALLHWETRRHNFIDGFSCPVPFGYAAPNPFALNLNSFEQFLFVKAEILAVVNQSLTVNDNGADIAADCSFHQRSNWIMHCTESNIAQVDNNN